MVTRKLRAFKDAFENIGNCPEATFGLKCLNSLCNNTLGHDVDARFIAERAVKYSKGVGDTSVGGIVTSGDLVLDFKCHEFFNRLIGDDI